MTERRNIAGRAGVELVVIVVGILIALAADTWADERADRRLEAEYLMRLIDDLEADSAQIVDLREHFVARIDDTRAILEGIRVPSGFNGDYEAVISAVGIVSGSPSRLQPSTSTLRELESTGRLVLFRNVRTRAAAIETSDILQEWSDIFLDAERIITIPDFAMAIPDPDWEAVMDGQPRPGPPQPLLQQLRSVTDWDVKLRAALRTVSSLHSVLGRLDQRVGYALCVLRMPDQRSASCVDRSGL